MTERRRFLATAGGVIASAAAATVIDAPNVIAQPKVQWLKTEFKGQVDVLLLPAPVLRDLRKLSVEVVKAQSERSPMARKVNASFAKFQALVSSWDQVAESAYQQYVRG